MMTEYEAAKLQRDMHHELDASALTVAKCALGLAIVALVAAFGAIAVVGREPVDMLTTPQPAAEQAAEQAQD
jgi:hypothetical protein